MLRRVCELSRLIPVTFPFAAVACLLASPAAVIVIRNNHRWGVFLIASSSGLTMGRSRGRSNQLESLGRTHLASTIALEHVAYNTFCACPSDAVSAKLPNLCTDVDPESSMRLNTLRNVSSGAPC